MAGDFARWLENETAAVALFDSIGDDIPEAPPGTFDNTWSDEPPAVLQPGRELREAVARAMTPDWTCTCLCDCPAPGQRDDDGTPGWCDPCRMNIHQSPAGLAPEASLMATEPRKDNR